MHSASDADPAGWSVPAPRGWARALAGVAAFGGAREPVAAGAADEGHRRALDAARHYRHLYYSAPVALVSSDPDGTVLRWNDRAGEWFGERLRRGRVNGLAGLLGAGRATSLLADVARHGRHRCELRVPVAGTALERVCAVEASRVGDAVELSLVDVSERSRLADTLDRMAHHDVLTEQLNRRGLERALEARLADPELGPTAMVYIDLDRFKAINDVFGHAAGDRVVAEVAGRLRATLPADADLARIGGDEFVALLPGLRVDGAQPVAAELLDALTGEPCLADGLRLDIEASLGVVEVAAPMQVREALALADEACARAKRGGGARIIALRPGDGALDALRASVRLGSMIKSRLPVDRLRLYAQPIVPLAADAGPCAFEVLLRTLADDGRIESPGPLLEAAERHGAMPAIDRFVLERTVEHLAANPAHARSAGFFAVNLSGPSLGDERFVRDAVALLRAHRAIASRLCLEITESVAVRDLRVARRCIDAFVDAGASIALDDFGAGYTSFAYLKHLPASMIKIDGQFVVGLEHDVRQRGIVQAIARLAHELGMTCLAEWVESPATLRALLDLDVDYAQGFLFERPLAIETWPGRTLAFGALRDAREAQRAREGATQ